jgi:hypothetical protein
MAVYNEILIGRFNRWLQKLLSMKGSPPTKQLSSELQPTLEFFHGREDMYLQGWNLFWTSLNAGPTAAVNDGFQLRNPASSNAIMIIEELNLRSSVANQSWLLSLIRSPQVELTNVFAATGMDPRGIPSVGGGSSLVLSSFTNVVAFATSVYQWAHPTAGDTLFTIQDVSQQWLILPGDTYRITTGISNSQDFVSFKWRERALEESERF